MSGPQTTLVSSHRLTHLAGELDRRSGNKTAVKRALEAAGLGPDDIGREGHKIDCQQEACFLQEAIVIVGDVSFAAKAGLNFDKNNGIPSYVAKYSKNLSEALQNAEKYTVLTDGNFSYQLKSSSNAASFILYSNNPFLKFGDRVQEFIVFGILAVMRRITAKEFYPLEIRFGHPAPPDRQSIARVSGCTIVFDAEETEIMISPATLGLPVPTYDPSLLGYLKDYGDGLLQQLGPSELDLRAQIEALLVDNLPERFLPANEVAASLGMSHRTFTRRLSAVGLSFSAIADELRSNLAKTYLAQSETPISEIAFVLNYSDQASFTTAFKRWTGATPKAFRASV